jgi:nitrogen-specific signal transduction histidine kinase
MPAAADLAHEARNHLAATLGRVQLLRRQAGRGAVDPARLLAALEDAEPLLRRLVDLVDALEDAAEAPARPSEAPLDLERVAA